MRSGSLWFIGKEFGEELNYYKSNSAVVELIDCDSIIRRNECVLIKK